jgi:glycosyltransferase involved in cell wall biosynthesis
MNNLYLIDTRGNLDTQKTDVIERHINYAKYFDKKCASRGQEGKIVVLGRYGGASDFKSRYLDVINISGSKRLPTYIWKTSKYLSGQNAESLTLIAGDPWHSTVAALIMQTILKKQVRIESQLHFDFINYFQFKGLAFSRVLRAATLIILGRVDQIRVVDPNTLEVLQNKVKKNEKIYLAPSLSNLDPTFSCSRPKANVIVPRLLFVGRLHQERNPSDFIKFLKLLDSKHFKYQARIVGDGPLKKLLHQESSDLVARGVLSFTGELTGRKLLEEYCKSDVLISCAKHESYGRAMREALFVGARVLSFETTGACSLQKEVGVKYVSFVSSDVTSDQLISKIDGLIRSQVDTETKQALLDGQGNILETLSERWDTLFNKSV